MCLPRTAYRVESLRAKLFRKRDAFGPIFTVMLRITTSTCKVMKAVSDLCILEHTTLLDQEGESINSEHHRLDSDKTV